MPTSNTEILQKDLKELNQAKKELAAIKEKLGGLLQDIDKTIGRSADERSEGREKACTDLIQELKDKHGIDLTSEEKNMLRDSGATSSSIAEIREGLEKLGIKVPKDASDFAVISCSAVAAALSRTLQKPENAYDIIKKSKAVDKEEANIDKFKTQCEKQFVALTDTIMELKNKVTTISGLSLEQQEAAEKIAASAAKPEEFAVQPGAPLATKTI